MGPETLKNLTALSEASRLEHPSVGGNFVREESAPFHVQSPPLAAIERSLGALEESVKTLMGTAKITVDQQAKLAEAVANATMTWRMERRPRLLHNRATNDHNRKTLKLAVAALIVSVGVGLVQGGGPAKT